MLKKRANSFEVEILSNGFVLSVTGRDEDDDWKTVKTYCMDKDILSEMIQSYVALPED